MTRTIDRATSALAAPANKWCVEHRQEIEHIAGQRARELWGYVYEIAIVKQRKGTLDRLTAAHAFKLARKRVMDECIVARPRGEDRPQIAGGDAVDLMVGTYTPLDRLVEIEDRSDDDHDDRLSWEAQRAAAGHQPIAEPELSVQTLARSRRRFRVRARNLHDAGQQDFWPAFGAAA